MDPPLRHDWSTLHVWRSVMLPRLQDQDIIFTPENCHLSSLSLSLARLCSICSSSRLLLSKNLCSEMASLVNQAALSSKIIFKILIFFILISQSMHSGLRDKSSQIRSSSKFFPLWCCALKKVLKFNCNLWSVEWGCVDQDVEVGTKIDMTCQQFVTSFTTHTINKHEVCQHWENIINMMMTPCHLLDTVRRGHHQPMILL